MTCKVHHLALSTPKLAASWQGKGWESKQKRTQYQRLMLGPISPDKGRLAKHGTLQLSKIFAREGSSLEPLEDEEFEEIDVDSGFNFDNFAASLLTVLLVATLIKIGLDVLRVIVMVTLAGLKYIFIAVALVVGLLFFL